MVRERLWTTVVEFYLGRIAAEVESGLRSCVTTIMSAVES